MGIRVIESLGSAPGYIPVMIGNTLGQTQTVTNQEVVTELTSRGYRLQTAIPISPPVSPVLRTTLPTMTRSQAIKSAVTATLVMVYRLPLKCAKVGGCPMSVFRWEDIIRRAVANANELLRGAQVRTSTVSISPAASYTTATYTRLRGAGGHLSPKVRGIGGTLYGLGQADPVFQPVITQPPVGPGLEQPTVVDMSRTDWILLALSTAGAGLNVLQTYYQGKAARERAGVTATLTAQQVKDVVSQTMLQNPALQRSVVEAAAAGIGGRDEPKPTPGWVVPAVIGIGVVLVMGQMGRGRGRRR